MEKPSPKELAHPLQPRTLDHAPRTKEPTKDHNTTTMQDRAGQEVKGMKVTRKLGRHEMNQNEAGKQKNRAAIIKGKGKGE